MTSGAAEEGCSVGVVCVCAGSTCDVAFRDASGEGAFAAGTMEFDAVCAELFVSEVFLRIVVAFSESAVLSGLQSE